MATDEFGITGIKMTHVCQEFAAHLAVYNVAKKVDLRAFIKGKVGPYIWEQYLFNWAYQNRRRSLSARTILDTLNKNGRVMETLQPQNSVSFSIVAQASV
jgi:hypothetical protein